MEFKLKLVNPTTKNVVFEKVIPSDVFEVVHHHAHNPSEEYCGCCDDKLNSFIMELKDLLYNQIAEETVVCIFKDTKLIYKSDKVDSATFYNLDFSVFDSIHTAIFKVKENLASK